MPDYAQLQQDEYERELKHYFAGQQYKDGYDAFFAGRPKAAMPTADMRDGWLAARDNTMVSARPIQREPDGDILFA